MDDNNLTDSQRRLLAAIRTELGFVSKEIMAEIEKLRQEQKQRHEEGMKRQDDLFGQLKAGVRRHTLGLLGLVGVGDEELEEWAKKHR